MRKLLGSLFVVALMLSACGGGNDNKSDNASASSETTSAPSGGGAGNFSDFCGARGALSAGATAGTPDTNALKTAAQNIDKAVSYAPSEIKSDVRVMVDAAKPFIELMASVNYDFMKLANDPAKQQQLQTLEAKFSEPQVKAASERVNAWVEAHCK